MSYDVETTAAFDRLTRTSWSASELLAYEFPEPRWAIPGLLAEGVNLLAGPPKVGKSWKTLNHALAVASGGKALGKIDVEQGPVLYLALEDTGRRLQTRMKMLLGGEGPPPDLILETECARFPEGLDKLYAFHDEHPDARLVIVDVLARVRPARSSQASAYDTDYEAVSLLKSFADDRGVAVELVTHTRKAQGDDFLDDVSGTQGIAGAADAVLMLRRSRNSADAILKVTGRDIEEAEHALRFDPGRGLWLMLDGPAGDYELDETRRAILRAVREHGRMKPKEISEVTRLDYELVKKTVQRMFGDGQLDSSGQGYYFDPETPVPGVPDVPQLGGMGDSS